MREHNSLYALYYLLGLIRLGRYRLGLKMVWVIISVLTLSACGGEEELRDHQAEGTNSSGTSLILSTTRSTDGEGSLQINSDVPLILEMTLTDLEEEPISGQIISLTSTLVTFSPSSGTALTDSEGKATITLIAGSEMGAGVVTAVAVVDGQRISVPLNLEVTSSTEEENEITTMQVSLSLTSDAGSDIIRADAEGALTVTVIDADGLPLANELVTLTITEDLAVFGTSNATLLTNASGQASTTVSALDAFGAGTITASVVQGEQIFSKSINFVVTQPAIQLSALTISVNPLSAGGTTSVEVNVLNEDGYPFTTPLDIQFSSTCVSSELATIDATVTTIDGAASATYRAGGCEGTDTVTATTTFGGATFSVQAELKVQQDVVGAIEFVNADPAQITLLGTGAQGLSESSEVSFRVRGEQGLPIANQQVDFALTTAVGGITLAPTFANTDSDGVVYTVVQAGSVATSVGVIATVSGTDIATQSDLLAVSTGIPDQDSMDLSAEFCAPEGWDHFNEEMTVSVGVGDAFNNPVPDGTAVTFTTEGGVIEGVCTTTGGVCTVTWSSQEPYPTDGLATIMATAIGHESFADENGNGVFDDGDTFTDLSEAYRDDDYDGVRDAAEPYIDFDEDRQFDTGDAAYNGVLCQHSDPTQCGEETSVTVRADQQIAIAGSTATIIFVVGATTFNPGTSASVDLTGGAVTFTVTVQDINGNSMPTGSSVTFSTDNGELLGADEFEIGCRTGARSFTVTLVPDDESSTDGFIVEVETPKGQISSRTLIVRD